MECVRHFACAFVRNKGRFLKVMCGAFTFCGLWQGYFTQNMYVPRKF
ncbi:hypothetical protein PFLU3_25320 [Pseudomonas fluorescens]|uniref:Uncharacterized protein n=1 Tax=Pseudomonas fluorescens TaxID=294 RepID=A0A0D0TM00_PSEFL|nr:hypothetical protein C4K02_1231 [Pseudomonas synxantha]KIR21980.1 hypothetical protein PFLU3_25320 [Pseudomonas fluorescens]